MKKTLMILSIIAIAAQLCLADLVRPDPKKPAGGVVTTLSIRLDSDAKEARLVIPRSQVRQLRAELEQFDDGGRQTAAVFGNGFSNLRTIVSGTLLSLAFIFGGLWFVRNGKNGLKAKSAAAVGLLLLGAGAFGSIVFGNAGPPPEARTITGKMFSQAVHIYKYGSGRIRLVVSDEETMPVLIVPDPKEAKTAED